MYLRIACYEHELIAFIIGMFTYKFLMFRAVILCYENVNAKNMFPRVRRPIQKLKEYTGRPNSKRAFFVLSQCIVFSKDSISL
jgi:hypothetical protein